MPIEHTELGPVTTLDGLRLVYDKELPNLLRQFKRRSHHYIQDPPRDSEVVEWLSLMQHYGAPTRLLDWTYSFYAAVFFALEGDSTGIAECCVWAISTQWLVNRFRHAQPWLFQIVDSDRNLRRPGTFHRVFRANAPFVCPVNPARLNDRLAVQQGIFLVPGDPSLPFEENIAAMQDGAPDARQKLFKVRISLEPEKRCASRLSSQRIYRRTIVSLPVHGALTP